MKKFLVPFLLLSFLLISLPCFAFVNGDVNSDNKVNLAEALYALQVTAGVRTTGTVGTTINVPSQIDTIQGAIDAASSGDTINIAAGSYTETLAIKNKSLTIQGAGNALTVITGVASSDTLTVKCHNIVNK